ncbi:MAG: hypothetical protein V1859_05730 [archaeon]
MTFLFCSSVVFFVDFPLYFRNSLTNSSLARLASLSLTASLINSVHEISKNFGYPE